MKMSEKTYAAFLDVNKFFDQIDRDVLFHILEQMNIPGH